MSLVSLTLPANGERIDAEDVNIPFNALANVINGNLDSTNIASLNGSKILAGTLPATALNTAALQGWNSLSAVPNTVTPNGNRSYDLTFNATDLTSTLCPGMRLRTTRSVPDATQSTSLNGTTQFFSRLSGVVNGMTFTNNFVVGGWVKLTNYPSVGAGHVLSRTDGINGWQFTVETTGQLQLLGFNAGGGNYSLVKSYQSIPLNKWVHISAQLDMLSFTATPTTSYMMIDGVDVPATVSRAGTSPTALVQGTANFSIGAQASGAGFFPGKIAQAFVSSAKITQANVRTILSQGLTPALVTANSIISAYNFNGVFTDINTTNANDLTANGAATATNADSPFGGQANGTISNILDYAIIQKVTFATNTVVTVQVAEGCTIPASGTLASVSYSSQKIPYGMPVQDVKWTISSEYGASESIGIGSVNNFFGSNLKLAIPVGEWQISTQGSTDEHSTVSSTRSAFYALAATTPPAVSGGQFVVGVLSVARHVAFANVDGIGMISGTYPLSLSAMTTYSLWGATDVVSGAESWIIYPTTRITAKNSYL